MSESSDKMIKDIECANEKFNRLIEDCNDDALKIVIAKWIPTLSDDWFDWMIETSEAIRWADAVSREPP